MKQLGGSGNNIERVQLLAAEPAKAVDLLIPELHSVPEEKVTATEETKKLDTEHVLWVLRALRFLTGGKDFCATTQYEFGKAQDERDRRYWLTFHKQGCIAFFAMWPSRGTTYIAPRAAQEEIINKWKRWHETEGATYKYKRLKDPKPGDWLW